MMHKELRKVFRQPHFQRAIRKCENVEWCTEFAAPHTWESVNPVNGLPFRRGRVVFFCPRNYYMTTIERMRMLRR